LDNGGFESTSGFAYDGFQEPFDIEISGGWTLFFGNPCGQRFDTESSYLSADGEDRVLRVVFGENSQVKVSGLVLLFGQITGASSVGGALFISGHEDENNRVLVERNSFLYNNADDGSAMLVEYSGEVIIRNNLFAHNGTATNQTVVDVVSGGNEKGLYFTNNTVVDNHGYGLKAVINDGAKAYIANNVLWDNTVGPDIFLAGNGYKYLRNNNFSSLFGSADDSSANISLPPQFFDPLNLNYAPLQESSPMVNSGRHPPQIIQIPPSFHESWSLGSTDVTGDLRINLGRVDMGAFEFVRGDLIFVDDFE
jgi:hypothetical protein